MPDNNDNWLVDPDDSDEMPGEEGLNAKLNMEYVSTRQPYYEMGLSQEDTTHIREKMQGHLQAFIAKFAEPLPNAKTVPQDISQIARPTFSLKLSHNAAGDKVIISPQNNSNELTRAKFWELGAEFTAFMKQELYSKEEMISDGKQIIITGNRALEAAMRAIQFVHDKPLDSPVKPFSFPQREIPQQAAPRDELEGFVSQVAFKAIQVIDTDLLSDANVLNQDGVEMQKNMVAAIKNYLARPEMNVQTMQQLKESNLVKNRISHCRDFVQHYTMMQPKPQLRIVPNLLRQAIEMMANELIKLVQKDKGRG